MVSVVAEVLFCALSYGKNDKAEAHLYDRVAQDRKSPWDDKLFRALCFFSPVPVLWMFFPWGTRVYVLKLFSVHKHCSYTK